MSVRHEYVSNERKTVAGESYTIAELYARHTNNHNPLTEGNVFFEDTEDFESVDLSKLKGMDLVDRQQLYEQVTEKAQSALQKLEEHKKAIEAQRAKESDERSGGAKTEPTNADKPKGDEAAPVTP